MWYLMTAAFAAGMLLPIQTAANARMRLTAGTAVVVTLISFVVSLLMLTSVSWAAGIAILPEGRQIAAVPWWGWSGGLIALFTITVTILIFQRLGQLQTAVLLLAGQLIFSLMIDHFALFGARRIELSLIRITAVLILAAGVLLVLTVRSKAQKAEACPAGGRGRTALLWQGICIIDGALMAAIGAIYGRLGQELGSAVQASTVSFFIAVAAIALICLRHGQIRKAVAVFRQPGPWWMWLGGVCGALSVFGNAWLIPQIGAGAFFMAFLLGQMVLSMLMESRGWLGAARRHITAAEFCGIVIMTAGAVLIRLN